jgi:hypothetical protein
MKREDLQPIVVEALASLGGRAKLIDVAKYVWRHHEGDITRSGDLFFTWQYDMRWAATRLRKAGKIKAPDSSRIWELA